MDNIEQINLIHGLERSLRLINQVQHVTGSDNKFTAFYNEICSTIFESDLYKTLWDEPTLSLVSKLYEQKPPHSPRFKEIVANLKTRSVTVKRINDLFFAILDSETDEDVIENILKDTLKIDSGSPKLCRRLGARLNEIRMSKDPPSKKVKTYLACLSEDLAIDFGDETHNIESCLSALKNREQIGMVNALVINSQTNVGAVIPLHAMTQPGTERVNHLSSANRDFQDAVERAMHCLKKNYFLSPTDGINFTMDITDVQYSGNSIALASAIAMWCSARKITLDPYTAFSGDINIADVDWVVRAVAAIPNKIEAALAYGCRRIFLPEENKSNIPKIVDSSIHIVLVKNIRDAITSLGMSPTRTQREGLNIRKTNRIHAFCQEYGWQLSGPIPVQHGNQFSIAPPNASTINILIYNTGSHMPTNSDDEQLNKLFMELDKLDETTISLRKIQEVFNLQDTELRSKIKEDLEKLYPIERREDQYCDYSWRFEDGKQVLWAKQYSSGKLVLQGYAADLYKQILEVIIPAYNIRYPQANLTISKYMGTNNIENSKPNHNSGNKLDHIVFPYIGTDESGKGDYFGPLVSAGVYVNERTAQELIRYGVRDSKLLSDNKNLELAQEIAKICKGCNTVIEISPERYNDLYDQFIKEGKNLNSLLAWGHAKALEEILAKTPCDIAIADQFADERFILNKLQEKGKRITLIQMHKAERNVGVAAASILARARFLDKLSKLSQEYGITFHKGASPKVIEDAKLFVSKYGIEALRKVAKLHFKTTRDANL